MSNNIFVDGIVVPKVNFDDRHFLNRLTILYGPSGSGKSALITTILNSLRDYIPLIIVCNPTNAQNGDYRGIAPDESIYDDLTADLMKRIFQRQTNVMAMYNLVRDPEHIRPLFLKIADHDARVKVNKVDAIFQKGCADIKNTYEDDEVDSAIEELTLRYNKKIVKIMRSNIIANLRKLQSRDLTDMQKTIITNFSIVPEILLLIDDCAASIKEWKDLEETKKLFFQGRHLRTTTLLTLQNESILPPPLRTNAHISIFTTQQIVNTFISKASSGIPPDQRKKISKIAAAIFAPSEDRSRPNYKKLVIFGQIISTPHKVQWIQGSPKKKRFGSAALWTMCENVKRDTSFTVNSNSFSKMFSMKAVPSLEPIPQ